MKLLLDWSVLCHQNWHIMRSPNYEALTDIEAQEFSRNLTSTVLHLTERFKPEEIIFAMDAKGKYWRHTVMDKYYRKNCLVYKYEKEVETTDKAEESKCETIYILEFDKKVVSVKYIDGPNKWVYKKLTIADKEELLSESLVKVKYKDVPEGIKEFYPKYKGHRSAPSWDYKTTKEEWHAMCNSIAKNLAVLFKAKIIEVPKAEADDVAKIYADCNSSQDMIFVTTDSDWSQLLSDHLFLKLYNPTKREWVDYTPEEVEYNLAVKIMGGDRSDDIPAISLKGDSTTLAAPSKKAKKLNKLETLLAEHGTKKIYDFLEDHADLDPLYRNYELIFLDNMHEGVCEKLHTALKKSKIVKGKKPYTLNNFGVDKKLELTIKGEAKEARDIDIEEERYEG